MNETIGCDTMRYEYLIFFTQTKENFLTCGKKVHLKRVLIIITIKDVERVEIYLLWHHHRMAM